MMIYECKNLYFCIFTKKKWKPDGVKKSQLHNIFYHILDVIKIIKIFLIKFL